MWKAVAGFIAGLVFVMVIAMMSMFKIMFTERLSPYGFEETIARIQHNVEEDPVLKANGWSLSGLRNPAKAVQTDGGNVLPVMMVEICSTKYSGPILKDDDLRILSILMPCKISVYKKQDGKTYIGTMNAGLMGTFFGIGDIMEKVEADQAKMLVFDASKPTPQMILPKAAPAGGGAGGGGGGC